MPGISKLGYTFLIINTANHSSSQITVAVKDSIDSPNPPFATTFYLAQLASDEYIYICNGKRTNKLHRIHNLNDQGLSCNVCLNSISMPTYNAFAIPNLPNYFLGAVSGSICDTHTVSLTTCCSPSAKGAFYIYHHHVWQIAFIHAAHLKDYRIMLSLYNLSSEMIYQTGSYIYNG